jgi:hypothetical protein
MRRHFGGMFAWNRGRGVLIIISIYILCVEYNNISDAGRNWCGLKIFVDGGIIIDL